MHWQQVEYLISWGPGFPGHTIAVKELIGGQVEMQEADQFWHTGLWHGVICWALWRINLVSL